MTHYFWFSAVLLVPVLVRSAVDLMNARHAKTAKVPAEFADSVDEKKFRDTQLYLAAQTKYQLVSRAFNTCVALAFLWLGGFGILEQWVKSFGWPPVGEALLYFGVLGLGLQLLEMPFSWYHTFVLEEKFGFNRSTLKTFLADAVKGLVLGALFGGAVLAAVLWFFLSTGEHAWFFAWAFVCVFQILVAFVAPVLIMPLFNKFTPLPEGHLKNAIEEYSRKMNFKMKGIFTMDGSKRSAKANAYFTGFGRFRRIVLFDTLVDRHPVPELVGVLAHEIGHFKRGHILKQIALSFTVFFFTFWLLSSVLKSEPLAMGMGFGGVSLYAGLIATIWLYSPVSLLLSLLFSYFSRKYEFEADAFASETTKDAPSLASALKRLSLENLSNLNPHPWKVILDYSHPPVSERIRVLLS